MTQRKPKARVSQRKIVHMYAELWHASECVLEKGIQNQEGSSWQFLSSIVLTAFAFEAYLNHSGQGLFASWDDVEPLPPLDKFNRICDHLQVSFPKGEGARPLQTLKKLQSFRNLMAHGKTTEIEPKPVLCPPEHADARLRQRPLDWWEKLIVDEKFAKLARCDIQEILTAVHAKRPKPKERLFGFGIGSGSAILESN